MSAETLAQDGTVADPAVAAWSAALDTLERDLDAAAELSAPGFLLDADRSAPVPVWSPPTGLGPLPESLADRAGRILDRQVSLVPQVEDAAQSARSHLRAVGSLRTNDTSASVYIDAVG